MPQRKLQKQKNVPSKKFTRMVKKVVDKAAEHKYAEASVTSLPFDSTPASATVVNCLDQDLFGNLVQGTASNQRIGDRVKLLSMQFRGMFIPTTATVGAVRIIVGQITDQQTASGLTLTYGEVLENISGANDFSSITSSYNEQPLVGYKILMDEVITWDAQNAAAPRLLVKHFNRLALRNRNYEGSSQIYTGAFFYMLLAGNGVAANLVYPHGKVVYTDI